MSEFEKSLLYVYVKERGLNPFEATTYVELAAEQGWIVDGFEEFAEPFIGLANKPEYSREKSGLNTPADSLD